MPYRRGQVSIRTSKDPVGAPIFYRDVPLMPSETEKGVIKPLATRAVPLIAWRLRNVAEPGQPGGDDGHPQLRQLPLFFARRQDAWGWTWTARATTRGCTPWCPVAPRMAIRKENVIAWSTFRGKLGGPLRVGFMSQVSPDGQYVVTTINDPGEDPIRLPAAEESARTWFANYYVANFKDYRFLQVFYPTRGILAWYDRATGRPATAARRGRPALRADRCGLESRRQVPGVCARGGAGCLSRRARRMAEYANDPNETQIQYDLYRIPFNGGKGGKRGTDRRRLGATA